MKLTLLYAGAVGGRRKSIPEVVGIPQLVPSQMFRNAEVIGGMDAEMLAAFGGMPPGSSATQPTCIPPSQLEPPTAPTIPSSIPPSTTIQPQLTHPQSMPPPGILTVSSEDLAGIAGQGAIAWDPSQPPPAGYLLVAVLIPNSINISCCHLKQPSP